MGAKKQITNKHNVQHIYLRMDSTNLMHTSMIVKLVHTHSEVSRDTLGHKGAGKTNSMGIESISL